MTIGTWITQEEGKIASWFTDAEHELIQFFGPLFKQILAQAEVIAKDDLSAGLKVILDAATSAVTAAATSPGDKVAAAEKAFIKVAKDEGITAVHNAEAGAIKAAVAAAQGVVTAVVGQVAQAPAV